MAASVTVRRDFGDLRSLLPQGHDLMREIGDVVTDRIRRRTEQEQGYQGEVFPPLSAGYARAKGKAIGSTRADLSVSGRMLNDMGPVAATDTSVTISFRSQGGRSARGQTFIQRSRAVGAADKAFFHVTGNHGIVRDFFGLSDDDETAVLALVERAVERGLDRI